MANILVHLGGGIGNVILATPALASLAKGGHSVDLYIRGDFKSVMSLFNNWPLLRRVSDDPEDFVGRDYDYYLIGWLAEEALTLRNADQVKTLRMQYHRKDFERISEADLYFEYARMIDPGIPVVSESYCGHSDLPFHDISKNTVVLFAGCKKEYPMKRWDKFDLLAEKFSDVAVIGTSNDMDLTFSRTYPEWIKNVCGDHRLRYPGKAQTLARIFSKPYNRPQTFGAHVKNYVGRLTLADTASLIRQAGCFIGNDGGITHVAAALGVPTFFIFGPSSVKKAMVNRSNIHIIQKGLDCQPCQSGGQYPSAWQSHGIGCPIGVKCLADLSADDVYQAVISKWKPNE